MDGERHSSVFHSAHCQWPQRCCCQDLMRKGWIGNKQMAFGYEKHKQKPQTDRQRGVHKLMDMPNSTVCFANVQTHSTHYWRRELLDRIFFCTTWTRTTMTFLLSRHMCRTVEEGRCPRSQIWQPHPSWILLVAPSNPPQSASGRILDYQNSCFIAQETLFFSWFDFCTNQLSGVTVDLLSSLRGLKSKRHQFNIFVLKAEKVNRVQPVIIVAWQGFYSKAAIISSNSQLSKHTLEPEVWNILSVLSLARSLMCWYGFYNGLSAPLLSRR